MDLMPSVAHSTRGISGDRGVSLRRSGSIFFSSVSSSLMTAIASIGEDSGSAADSWGASNPKDQTVKEKIKSLSSY